MILSETLEIDHAVDQNLVAPARLLFLAPSGAQRDLSVTKDGDAHGVAFAGEGTIAGTLDLGLMRRGDIRHRLVYFPKAIVGNPFGPAAREAGTRVELAVVGQPGAARLRFAASGRPVADAEVILVRADGSQKTLKTDEDGLTPPIGSVGRHGAWARHWIDERGQLDGQDYAQVRLYATLVFDLPGERLSAPGSASESLPKAQPAGRLPEASSSLGSVVDGEWLYVYGGHVVPTHDYARDSVSGAFHRRHLKTGVWETLPPGPAVQGMNLTAHKGFVYRIGGMQPRNAAGQPQDIWSIADAARFDPLKKRWEPLPPLPEARSSHDVVIVGDTLFVIGGWVLAGSAKPRWPETMFSFDLTDPSPRWEESPQPFARRAFVAGVLGARVIVVGGFDAADRIVDGVDVFDAATREWTHGPNLPKGPRNGFSPAVATLGGALFASLGDGGLYRLTASGAEWHRVGQSTPRLAHRMVATGDGRLLILGGAANGDNLDLIEEFRPTLGTAAVAPPSH